jgi:hypothetical protein
LLASYRLVSKQAPVDYQFFSPGRPETCDVIMRGKILKLVVLYYSSSRSQSLRLCYCTTS